MQTEQISMPELLYFGRGNTPSAKLHKHAFYQMELCVSGVLLCHTEDKQFILRPGELWLIPPGFKHQFVDNRKAYEYLSLKFKHDAMLPQIKRNDDITKYYLDVILAVIDQKGGFSPYSQDGKSVIENHLYGLLFHLLKKADRQKSESHFIMSIREEVCKRGYKMNVDQLAQFCCCTRSQFKYKFATENKGDGNIKQFIDNILIEMADKHLTYSALSFGKIAKELNFPSIYVFSRFFKRKTGITPSEYRAKSR